MRLVPALKKEKGEPKLPFLLSAPDLIQKGKNRRRKEEAAFGRPVGIERLDQTDSDPVEFQWIVQPEGSPVFEKSIESSALSI